MKVIRLYVLLLAALTGTPGATAQERLSNDTVYIPVGTQNRHSTKLYGNVYTAARLQGVLRENRQRYPGKTLAVVFMEPGAYYPDSTLVITPELANGNGAVVIMPAHPGDMVTLSGGQPVKVKWRRWKNGIYKAKLALPYTFDHLYINDIQQIRARYPNYDSSAQHYNGSAADAVSPERVKTWKHPQGGYVHALHKGEWGGYHYRITGVNPDYSLQMEGGYQNNRQMGMHASRRFVENIFEELDTAREWYYDQPAQTLYYKPAPGTRLSGASVVVSRLPQVIALKGTADNPVRNVTIAGLRLAHTAPTFMDTREPLLRSDWTIYRGGTILLDGTENCTIRDCEFDHNGGNAVFVSNYNRHATISGCHIHDAGGSGICFVGSPDAVRSPLFEYNESQPLAAIDTVRGPKTSHYPDSCTAYDNLIYRTGTIEKQTAGIQLSMAMNISVLHNSIYDVPRAGINVSEGTFGGHDIAYNDVFNTVLETGDHGAFNSWGRDRYWHPDRSVMNDLTEAHPELILLDAVHTTRLHHNRFRCDHGWDIDLDDGSSNYYIYNNVCLNGGLKLREGFYRTVENNVILNNSFHPHVWFKNSHDVFRHNIVTGPYKPIGIRYWGDELDFNLFPDKAALPAETDRHSVAGDPGFVNPIGGDYRVKAASPALRMVFNNFPMDSFGVVSPALRLLAKKAPLPVLQQQHLIGTSETTWLGARVKNIETLGERSAAGLPDNNGVYLISIPDNFPYRLQAGDVILKAGNTVVKNVEDLLKAYTREGDKPATLTIFRDQRQIILGF
ncbi:right-handed parallel beta-helix repeat-containing protein [Chitinophaga oryzae]|uniref:Right-handed parallel beta-helix repeat-containing protein n=2 Tax=Chitinophaga oryzae TaxID=2725414 RepID=A0AAE7D618_9BACT|nr:PDZ domain-containing protein [Chitinophaga oryzae]QJB30222.1 right-handed parallel beta-helix repeat-containing protein [Chitinophaga oryzae]